MRITETRSFSGPQLDRLLSNVIPRSYGITIALMVGLLFGCSMQPPDSTSTQGVLSRLEIIQDRNARIEAVSFDEDGYPDYLAGQDLGHECIGYIVEKSDYVDYASCVIEQLAAGVLGDSEIVAVGRIHVRSSERDSDGYRHLMIDQLFQGNAILDHEIDMTLDANDQLLEFSGRIFDLSNFSADGIYSRFSTSDEALRWAREQVSKDSVLVRRYFDPEYEAVMIEIAEAAQENIRYVLNERTGHLHESINLTSNSHTMSLQRVNHTVHDNNIGIVVDPALNISWREYHTNVRVSEITGGCEFSLDHGSSHDQGEPKVGVKYYGTYRPNGSTTYLRNGNCSDDNIMLFDSDFFVSRAANVYFWIHDLASFVQHPRAAYNARYPWKNYDPKNLRVIVSNANLCPPMAAACAQSGMTEYKLFFGDDTGSTTDLATMAHEYGHIIHYMYDRTSNSFRGRSVQEGFADQNILRYAMFRYRENENRPFDDMHSLSYASGILGTTFNWTHGERFGIEGELAPSQVGGLPNWLLFNPDSTACGSNGDIHECGRVLAAIYWELAWNQCRSPYSNVNGFRCGSLESIISGTSNPETFANIAFTSAIRKLKDSSGLARFFDHVSWRYSRFVVDGQISPSDFARVQSVLNHHCLGWNNNCNSSRVLPDFLLPARRTTLSSFNRGCDSQYCVHILLAEKMDASDSVQRIHHTIRNTTIPVELTYASLDERSDVLSFKVDIPQDGLYEFNASVRTKGNCCNSMYIAANSSSVYWPWPLNKTGETEWQWTPRASSHSFNLKAGSNTIRLKYKEPILIEAIRIQKLSDVDNDGVSDIRDNCRSVPNFNQLNKDGDTQGDACDKCPTIPGAPPSLVSPGGHNDMDNDGIGDECDPDPDGDGIAEPLRF